MAQRKGLPVSRVGRKSLEAARTTGCERARGGVVERLLFLSLEQEQSRRPLALSQAPVCTDGPRDSTDVQIYEGGGFNDAEVVFKGWLKRPRGRLRFPCPVAFQRQIPDAFF